MNTLLITMLVTLGATNAAEFATKAANDPNLRCYITNPNKKKVAKKKPLPIKCDPVIVEKVVTQEVTVPVLVMVPAEVTITSPASTEWKVTKGDAKVSWLEKKEDLWLRLMGHVALGVGAREPHFSGLLGLRGYFPKIRLGVEGYTAFDYGVGLQGLVYPYQGTNLNWHLDLGLLGFGKHYVSAQDVPRPWDVTVGTGLEYKLTKHTSLALDWRWAIPSPIFIAENGWPRFNGGAQILGPDGRYLDVAQVFGNSFTESHLLLGLLFH